jgi:hypothetical protein
VISHLNIGISDFDRAYGFYAKVLPESGLVLKFKPSSENTPSA